jgi:hypothetical protein
MPRCICSRSLGRLLSESPVVCLLVGFDLVVMTLLYTHGYLPLLQFVALPTILTQFGNWLRAKPSRLIRFDRLLVIPFCMFVCRPMSLCATLVTGLRRSSNWFVVWLLLVDVHYLILPLLSFHFCSCFHLIFCMLEHCFLTPFGHWPGRCFDLWYALTRFMFRQTSSLTFQLHFVYLDFTWSVHVVSDFGIWPWII